MKSRENPSTGLKEWVFQSKDRDGFICINALAGGGDWAKVLESEQQEALQNDIETVVKAEVAANYVHRERKDELYQQFVAIANERLEQVGHNPADPQYLELRAMIPTIKELIGIREENTA